MREIVTKRPEFQPWKEMRRDLVASGWKTPNTYCNSFSPLIEDAAVYLFAVVDNEAFDKAFIAYVGMSSNLAQRMLGHPVKAQVNELGLYVMTWFKPTPKPELRTVERGFIQKFDPPWNIVGRTRGVSL